MYGNCKNIWKNVCGIILTESASAEEKSVIEKLLQSDMEWKAKYHELLEVHQLASILRTGSTVYAFYEKCNGRNCEISYCTGYQKLISTKRSSGELVSFSLPLSLGFLVYGFGQIDWTCKR